MKRIKVIVSFLFLLLPLFIRAEFLSQELQGVDSLKVALLLKLLPILP